MKLPRVMFMVLWNAEAVLVPTARLMFEVAICNLDRVNNSE